MKKAIAYARLLPIYVLIPWLATFIIPLLFFFVASPFFLTQAEARGDTASSKLAMDAANVILGALIYFLIARWRLRKTGQYLSLKHEISREFHIFKRSLGRFVPADVFLLITIVSISIVFAFLYLRLGQSSEAYYSVPMNLNALFLGPLSEEFLFRRTLFRDFKHMKLNGFCLSSALIFMLNHGYDFSVSALVYLTQVFFVGLFAALLYEKSKSVFLASFFHIMSNATITIGMVFAGKLDVQNIPILPLLVVVLIVAVPGMIRLFHTRS
ncbi:MAG: CPBP family intramembrane metalloprotease [Spirochaetia bacterium]|nr:CPBP family intramembrane metalloprotease [Spirochaetia bacterium]